MDESHPSIAEAKDLAVRHRKAAVIIFHVGPDGRFGYASYGQSKRLCERARRWADEVMDRSSDDDVRHLARE